jgi:predicted nucleic acid-binding protein
MGKGYLADTNTIVDYLENRLPQKSIDLIDNIAIQFSVISRIELLVWQNISDGQLKVLNDFISASVIFGLSENIILKSIEVRKKYRLKLPDAIIAATAIVNNLTLLTRNISDFKKVATLNCINPHHFKSI